MEFESDIVTAVGEAGGTSGIVLGESPCGPFVDAAWAGSLLALGACVAQHAESRDGSQLVVAVTVPVRDLAAVLIGCGWMLKHDPDIPGDPADTVATLTRNTPVRMVTDQQVVAHRYFELVPSQTGPRIHVGASYWALDRIRQLTAVPDLAEQRFGRRDIGTPGSLTRLTGQSPTWAARQCAPRTDLAILGTKSWLEDDMNGYVGWGHEPAADKIGSILLPDTEGGPTWATRIYAAQVLQDLELPPDVRLAVLDGASAIRWLSAVESDVVVAVIDRRTTDDIAAETVMQVRARSVQLLELKALGWHPPPGVEALAFKVAL
jgi:hypothetical protein